MKKRLILLLCLTLGLASLSACGEESDNLTEYKTEMETFFEEMENYDSDINSLDPNDEDSVSALFEIFDEMEVSFKDLSELEVPEKFAANKELASQAYDYMVQANEYFHESFTDTSYNEYTLEAAMECYKRANKRVSYMISILHGVIPEDESVSG